MFIFVLRKKLYCWADYPDILTMEMGYAYDLYTAKIYKSSKHLLPVSVPLIFLMRKPHTKIHKINLHYFVFNIEFPNIPLGRKSIDMARLAAVGLN